MTIDEIKKQVEELRKKDMGELILTAIRKNEVVNLLRGGGEYELYVPYQSPDIFPTDMDGVLIRCFYNQTDKIKGIENILSQALYDLINGDACDVYIAVLYFYSILFYEEKGEATFFIDREDIAQRLMVRLAEERDRLQDSVRFANGMERPDPWKNILRINKFIKRDYSVSIVDLEKYIRKAIEKNEVVNLLRGDGEYRMGFVYIWFPDVLPTDFEEVLLRCFYDQKSEIDDIEKILTQGLYDLINGDACDVYIAVLYLKIILDCEEKGQASFFIDKEGIAHKLKGRLAKEQDRLHEPIQFNNQVVKTDPWDKILQINEFIKEKYSISIVDTEKTN